MMLQLQPPIPLITPKGKADAHVLIDPGKESHLYWVCFLADGICWTFKNADVRLEDNPTEGRVSTMGAAEQKARLERIDRLMKREGF